MNVKLLLTLAAGLAATAANAEDAMRCGNRLVGDGDPKAKVADLCGKPTQTEKRTIYRGGIPTQAVFSDASPYQSISDRELLIHDRSLVEVEVDVWIYNRGRTRLMQEVVFHDNRVIEVNQLGRGY